MGWGARAAGHRARYAVGQGSGETGWSKWTGGHCLDGRGLTGQGASTAPANPHCTRPAQDGALQGHSWGWYGIPCVALSLRTLRSCPALGVAGIGELSKRASKIGGNALACLRSCLLQMMEDLEQLKVLENGYRMKVRCAVCV